ncbi:hypothetical protein F5144DRAFT_218292 [Chaetomium tenue]|uniref:Uncharacterized protein n=1 Tax=Chaetomium tenue TaxID=1854479 RepID=A0ACB7P5H6_9PEZI|nr:hypothetical protein F5144DRAFT_218292 [Chaetomium globosum]
MKPTLLALTQLAATSRTLACDNSSFSPCDAIFRRPETNHNTVTLAALGTACTSNSTLFEQITSCSRHLVAGAWLPSLRRSSTRSTILEDDSRKQSPVLQLHTRSGRR